MKTKTKKDDQQEVYKANESTNTIAIAIANANANESSTSSAIVTKKNNDGEKNFKTEIDTAQKLSAEKEKWEKFSKKINRFGVLKLENLNSEAIQNIAEWLNTSPSGKLMGLEIHWIKGAMSEMDYKAAKALASAIQNNSTINSLKITQSDIDNKTAEFIAEAIKSNTKNKITELSLSENNITAEGAKVLFETLKFNTTITSLSLKHSDLGDGGANAFADVLETNTTIASVDLSENNITAVGAQALAKMLKINKTIDSLYISDNNIGDEGAKVLAEALKINPTLTLLNISHNNIVGEGANALAETLKTNTTITALYIIDIYFSEDALPYIEMINQQCALNAQRVLIENNIAAALDLLTAHPNPNDGNVTSVRDVNSVIAKNLFVLDKADKLNTDEVRKNPNSVLNKYT
jgi:hypothetical protein